MLLQQLYSYQHVLCVLTTAFGQFCMYTAAGQTICCVLRLPLGVEAPSVTPNGVSFLLWCVQSADRPGARAECGRVRQSWGPDLQQGQGHQPLLLHPPLRIPGTHL